MVDVANLPADSREWMKGGYAFFPGTYVGAARHDLTCLGCRFSRRNPTKYGTYHYCDKATKMAKSKRATIKPEAPACKYWEARK